MVLGIDTSHFDAPIDWAMAKTRNVVWMYTKATQGLDFIDPTLKSHTDAAASAGVLTGAYHFLMANMDGKKQAQFFLNAVNKMAFDIPFILDWEEGSVQGQTPVAQMVQAKMWLNTVEAASGKTPIIYIGEDLAMVNQISPDFARYPLLVADYNQFLDNKPPIPPPWTNLFAWQFTDSYRTFGVDLHRTVDANWFYGTLDDLVKMGKK